MLKLLAAPTQAFQYKQAYGVENTQGWLLLFSPWLGEGIDYSTDQGVHGKNSGPNGRSEEVQVFASLEP